MERIQSVNERVSVNKTEIWDDSLIWNFGLSDHSGLPGSLICWLPLPPAQPGCLEPAPLRRHDGARHGWPDVLRAGQGDGFGAELPRLHFLPQARPGPCGVSWLQGNPASNQPQGGSCSLLFFQSPPQSCRGSIITRFVCLCVGGCDV